MNVINPIILNGLRTHVDKNSGIPNSVIELVEKLLEAEAAPGLKEGIDKVYEVTLEKFVDDKSLEEWSKEHGS